jgi:hypothetical protein
VTDRADSSENWCPTFSVIGAMLVIIASTLEAHSARSTIAWRRNPEPAAGVRTRRLVPDIAEVHMMTDLHPGVHHRSTAIGEAAADEATVR